MIAVEKVAVIDVGSNSCRMVIYERAGSALISYFNEKSTPGLGRGLPETGKLNPDGRDLAMDTFRRFRAILDGLDIKKVLAVGTAAVRVATDSKSFLAEAESVLDIPIRVLSGQEEGTFSALGVASGFRSAKGLVVDLGGTSLEVQRVGSKLKPEQGETFLVGPLARAADQSLSIGKRRKVIASLLAASKLLTDEPREVYAVGGAWRNVALVHMALTGYPLGVPHGYRLTRKALAKVIRSVDKAKQDADLQDRLQLIAKRRYETLLHAALVLDEVLDLAGKESAYVSAYGLREGVISDAEKLHVKDGLLGNAGLYFNLSSESMAFGHELFRFLKPVIEMIDQHSSVLEVSCLVADAGARLHADHRCDLLFNMVLRAPLPGLSHQERLFVAYAVASRYSFKFPVPDDISKLMTDKTAEDARLLGTAMRLAGVYSGRSAEILKDVKLVRESENLRLLIPAGEEDMISAAVQRRLSQLASLLKLNSSWECLEPV